MITLLAIILYTYAVILFVVGAWMVTGFIVLLTVLACLWTLTEKLLIAVQDKLKGW